MKSRNKLKWESEVGDSAKGWVTVVPSTGNGDTKVTINVKNEDGWADPDTLSGTVTFRCTNCQSSEDKTIDVCRCACSCCDLSVTPTVTSIPEAGLEAGKPIGTYTLTSRCGLTKISGTITKNGGTEQPLTIEGGNVKLTNAIPYNQEMSQATYSVKIFFDKGNLPDAPNTKCNGCCNPCTSWTITQAALECNCGNTVRGKVTYGEYFNGTKEIPQSGLTVGTQLFTYTLKQYCPSNLLTAKVTYASTTRNVTISNGTATLAQAIGSNDNTGKRDITLKVYYNGEECESKPTKQVGCTCENVLPNDEQFEVSIPTFNQNYVNECEDGQPCIAVKVGDKIGTYVKKAGTTCPETAITASLVSNGITYPLTCANGEVRLGGTRNILENSSHNPVPFTATVYYNGEECDSDQINQPGVACNCEDINGKVSEFSVIEKSGATAGFVLGTYSIPKPQCSDANDCMKIEEIDGKVGVKLENGKVKTTTNIPNNEDVQYVYFTFKVSYKVNNKWRECSRITTYQKGLECSCKMVTIFGGQEWVSFPISGTRGLVRFGKADTGLYKYKGTPQEEIVGVCGSLSADCNCSTIIPHDGLNVTTVAVPLTQEEIDKGLEMPHLYEFYVDLGSTATTAPITQRADLYFIPKDGSPVETCETEVFGFKYDPNACNCVMNNLSQTGGVNGLTCEGYSTVSNLGTVSATHTAMTITAELLTDGQEYDICEDTITSATYVSSDNVINLIGYGGFVVLSVDASQYLQEGETITNVRVSDGNLVIYIRKTTTRTVTVSISELVEGKKYTKTGTTYITDFTYTYASQTLTIKGKVASNMTSSQRIVGVVRVHYWCNKGSEVSEWYCGCKDFAILQNKGCTCDCDYVRARQGYTYYWDIIFSPSETYKTVELNSDTSDCSYYYLADADENGCITTGENGWCKVCVNKTYNGWVLSAEIVDNKHENRTTSVKVYSAYLSGYDEETHAPIYVDCDNYDISITDTKCDCDALDTDVFKDKTVTIPAGELPQSDYECWYNLFKVSDCIELYIVGDGGTPTGTSSSNKYEYKENGEVIYTAYVSNNCVYVSLKKDLDPTKTYTFVVKARYKDDNNEWQYCDPSATVTVKQKTCDCNAFKQKVSIDYYGFYYDQTYTQPERTLDVATASTGCGKGTLFVKYGGNKYCADDLNSGSWPTELNYIVGMSAPCQNGTLQLVVTPLNSEHTSRSTEIGVCLCKEELTDSCKCDDCEKTGTISESWSFDCSNVSCNDYNWYLQREASGEYQVPCGGISGALVATYPTPPECFSVELVCSHNAVHPYKQAIDENTVGIYINADAVDKKESPTVDVHVYKDGSICDSLSQEFIKITLCG